jgi:sigma-B regulation protein RsbU (phosphoserine phosphatase)
MPVLYTDGVTEAMSAESALFGIDRLVGCLSEKPASSCKDLVDRVTKAVTQFADGAPPSYDLTLVVLRYKGGNRRRPPG